MYKLNDLSSEINKWIEDTVVLWHKKNADVSDRDILSEYNTTIRRLNEHRDNIEDVIVELSMINTEMWHEQDKVRSDDPEKLLKAISNISPLNQRRNDLIEEIDEIILSDIED